MDSRELFFTGIRHGVPIVFGYVPVAIAYGVSALEAGFSPLQTIMMSVCVYSGAGQVLGVAMTAQQAGIAAIAIATFLINFRYFIMSTCVFSRIPGEKTWKRAVASFFVTDETFALFTIAPSARAKLIYAVGIILITYLSWVGGTVIGVIANAVLPQAVIAALGIALYALFIAIIMPGMRRSLGIFVLVVFTALLNTFLSMLIDISWAIVLSTLIAAGIGAVFIRDEQLEAEQPAVPGEEGQ